MWTPPAARTLPIPPISGFNEDNAVMAGKPLSEFPPFSTFIGNLAKEVSVPRSSPSIASPHGVIHPIGKAVVKKRKATRENTGVLVPLHKWICLFICGDGRVAGVVHVDGRVPRASKVRSPPAAAGCMQLCAHLPPSLCACPAYSPQLVYGIPAQDSVSGRMLTACRCVGGVSTGNAGTDGSPGLYSDT